MAREACWTALVLLVLAACAAPQTSPPEEGEIPGVHATRAPATPTASGAIARWRVLDDAPFARLEMATAAHDGRIWLAGGLSSFGEALTDVEIFDPASGKWSSGPSLPSGIHHAALVSDGERLLLIGGYLGSDFNRPTELVLVLSDRDDAWREGPALPDARGAGAAAWDGRRVVYAGGVAGGGVVADIYALESEAWGAIGAMAAPREHLAAASDGDGRVWLLGGRVGSLTSNVADVELLTADGVASLDPLPTPRGGVAAFHLDGLGACLSGGEAPDRAYTSVECIDAEGTITTLPELNEPHHGHGAAVVDGVAFILLGGPEPTLSAGSTVESLQLGR